MSVISRLNCNKQVGSGLARAFNEENKVSLMFMEGKRKQRRYGRLILRLKTNKQVIANPFSNKLQKLRYDY